MTIIASSFCSRTTQSKTFARVLQTVVVYLKGCQLCAVHVYPEGVEMLRAGVRRNAAAPQGHSRLAHFILALVLVKPQLAVLD